MEKVEFISLDTFFCLLRDPMPHPPDRCAAGSDIQRAPV
jgi:hypothetical protein